MAIRFSRLPEHISGDSASFQIDIGAHERREL